MQEYFILRSKTSKIPLVETTQTGAQNLIKRFADPENWEIIRCRVVGADIENAEIPSASANKVLQDYAKEHNRKFGRK